VTLPCLASVLVGLPRRVLDDDPYETAFFKHAVNGRVMLRSDNLDGDAQADLTVHGGPDKAVCVYSADHHAAWREELGVAGIGSGAFGENFSVEGHTESTVSIGDRFRVGGAIVEVSQPRGPCWKLSRRWRRPDLPKRVIASQRTGWYFRVVSEGQVGAGDTFELLDRAHPEWTIARAVQVLYAPHDRVSVDDLMGLASCEKLARGWRLSLARRLIEAGVVV
jgi:MOSC domain-containing protein YiiM